MPSTSKTYLTEFNRLQYIYIYMSTDNLELLDKIQYPEDLRQLPVEQLPELCAELRQDIVKELSVNPGHLASSLGVV